MLNPWIFNEHNLSCMGISDDAWHVVGGVMLSAMLGGGWWGNLTGKGVLLYLE